MAVLEGGKSAQSRLGKAGRRVLALALASAALAALASPAAADPPAQGEYTLHLPSASGADHRSSGGIGDQREAGGSAGSSNAAIVVLIAGCATIGVGALLVHRRRSTPTE